MPSLARITGLFGAALVLTTLSQAAGASTIQYQATGFFDAVGPNKGDGYVGYFTEQPTGPATLQLPNTLNLGILEVEPLSNPGSPGPASYSYNNEAFTINVAFSGLPTGAGQPDNGVDVVQFKGVINGTLTGNDQSTVTASFTSISQVSGNSPLPFNLSSLQAVSPVPIVPSDGYSPHAGSYGETLLFATINTPEPSAVAVWGLVATAGLATAARRRRAAVS